MQDEVQKHLNIEIKIAEIFGLETSPDGEPYQLLEYDDAGNVVAGTDYQGEVSQLATFFYQATQREVVEARLDELSYISPATRRDKDGKLLRSVGGREKELDQQRQQLGDNE